MDNEQMTEDMQREFILYPLAVMDAVHICGDKIREIQKDGGSIQRSLGVTWLQRIQRRLYDIAFARNQ